MNSKSCIQSLSFFSSSVVSILLMGLVFTSHSETQVTQAQTIRIEPGWNLIVFQVLPANTSPSAVFDTNSFSTVWTYDNATSEWRQYGRMGANQPMQNQIASMGDIELGRGYWAYFSRASATNWIVTGVAPESAYSLNFHQGWNLVGVAGNTNATEVNIISLFKQGDMDKIQYIARWEALNQRYVFYDPTNAITSEFQTFSPNLAYWVSATTNISIQPDMVVEAEGDSDLLPLQDPPVSDGDSWTPGTEDISNSIPGAQPVFHDRSSQTTIRIANGRDSIILPLYNRGGGILAWTATLLSRGTEGDTIALGSAEVSSVLSMAQSRGITSSETDTLKILVDRTHLSPGVYLAQLKIEASTGQQKIFDLVIEVGGLDGQWQGQAYIQTVNNRANAVADVDLFLHLFQDTKPGSHQLRGMMDSQETLLWPVDAPVLGHITDVAGNSFDPNFSSRFVISGGFTLPPGDVNHQPFENFPDTNSLGITTNIDAETGLEFLSNAEGDRWYHTLADRLSNPNFINPFPRFIAREFELIGQLNGSEGGAAVATGDYYETITGMMPQPIQIRGTFRLVRKSYAALERRPYKYFDTTVPLNGIAVASSSSATRTIHIPDHILIKRVLIVVPQDAATDKHTLEITAPNGARITLHDGQMIGSSKSAIFDSGELPIDPLSLLDPPELRGAKPLPTAGVSGLDTALYELKLREALASYVVRRPRESLNAFSDLDAYGNWNLKYVNLDSANHQLLGWSVLVYGVPASPVEGNIIVEGSADSNRFKDVAVQVLGLNANLGSAFTEFNTTNGHFKISSLPGVQINLAASKPGYLPGSIDNLNSVGDPRGFRDGLGGILVGGAGTANLTITLRLPSIDTLPTIFTHQQTFSLIASNGVAPLTGGSEAFLGSNPDSELCWDLEWLGVDSPPVEWSTTGTRAPAVNLEIPTSAFSITNNFTLAYRTRAKLCANGSVLATGQWVTVAIQNPMHPTNASPFWNTLLVQGTLLQGFGAIAPPDIGTNSSTGLHAQKTDVSKVDVDRPPLINPDQNPAFLFSLDGLTEAGNGETEDSDLHPRTFTIHAARTYGNEYAYAEILPIPDGRYMPLRPPLPGQGAGDYDDINQGIDGLNIYGVAEPVRIYTAIGGRICNVGVSATDGRFRVSAGANPGRD